jgi:drug/metabolite transporter (DMT)-like permease
MGKKISPYVLGAVAVAVVGVYMLCFSKGFTGIYLADLLVFICAVCFALHIMAIDEFVGITGGIKLSIMQFLVCGVISGILSLIFEARDITLANLYSALGQILYLGLMSSAVAYTLQITGQKYAEPSVASISMSFESVFAALGGWIIMGNGLSPTQIAGCVIMFASLVLAQIPEFSKKK